MTRAREDLLAGPWKQSVSAEGVYPAGSQEGVREAVKGAVGADPVDCCRDLGFWGHCKLLCRGIWSDLIFKGLLRRKGKAKRMAEMGAGSKSQGPRTERVVPGWGRRDGGNPTGVTGSADGCWR